MTLRPPTVQVTATRSPTAVGARTVSAGQDGSECSDRRSESWLDILGGPEECARRLAEADAVSELRHEYRQTWWVEGYGARCEAVRRSDRLTLRAPSAGELREQLEGVI